MARRPSSVCKLLRKSLLLAGKWPDRHQTCTRWSLGEPASRVCSRSRSKVKGHVIRALSWILGMSYSIIDSLVALYIYICEFQHIHVIGTPSLKIANVMTML